MLILILNVLCQTSRIQELLQWKWKMNQKMKQKRVWRMGLIKYYRKLKSRIMMSRIQILLFPQRHYGFTGLLSEPFTALKVNFFIRFLMMSEIWCQTTGSVFVQGQTTKILSWRWIILWIIYWPKKWKTKYSSTSIKVWETMPECPGRWHSWDPSRKPLSKLWH